MIRACVIRYKLIRVRMRASIKEVGVFPVIGQRLPSRCQLFRDILILLRVPSKEFQLHFNCLNFNKNESSKGTSSGVDSLLRDVNTTALRFVDW